MLPSSKDSVVDVTTGRRYGRSIDPGTNGYTTARDKKAPIEAT